MITENDLKEVKAVVKETVDGAVEVVMDGMQKLHEETTQRIDHLETRFDQLKTGWILLDNGDLELTTPFAGFKD